MTTSPTSIDSNKIKEVLESIGYNLIDCGNHWRTSAIYRNGDNKTAVQIYKNTGVWNDYIENKGSKPLEALIQLTLKDDRTKLKNILDGIQKGETYTYTENKELIEMEKIYPESALERLFPNYNFYKNKLISELQTQLVLINSVSLTDYHNHQCMSYRYIYYCNCLCKNNQN
jgi:hypothetical protein